MVQSSEYILKLIINKAKIGQEKFAQLLNLIWEVKSDLRVAYLKNLDPLKLSYSSISLILENFKKIQ